MMLFGPGVPDMATLNIASENSQLSDVMALARAAERAMVFRCY
jgi:hypothetical protein